MESVGYLGIQESAVLKLLNLVCLKHVADVSPTDAPVQHLPVESLDLDCWDSLSKAKVACFSVSITYLGRAG